jgi:hypothetical protein
MGWTHATNGALRCPQIPLRKVDAKPHIEANGSYSTR